MNANTISNAANVELFGHKSSDPKHNAQKNLNGRTHYVDDDTLRFFGSRIISAYPTDDRLFFKIVESVATDHNKSRRGFRVVVFDLFGCAVFRPSFDECTSTSAAAVKLWMKSDKIDPATYYRADLKHRASRLTNQAHAMHEAAAMLDVTGLRYWREVLKTCGHYELLTFHLANGHAYTPDFVVWAGNNVIECHEVKGSYRLPSHGRARLAFDQAAVEWPCFRWVWAELTKAGEWFTAANGGAG
jgi:hypothetical protein